MTSTIDPTCILGASLSDMCLREQLSNAKADIETLQAAVSSLAAIVSPPAPAPAISEGE